MIDFENRLKSLKERRQGSRERAIFESMDSFAANQAILTGRDVRKREFFETLNESAGVKYAIGAMAAVDEAATKVSIREGERVADSLIKSLRDGLKKSFLEKWSPVTMRDTGQRFREKRAFSELP